MVIRRLSLRQIDAMQRPAGRKPRKVEDGNKILKTRPIDLFQLLGTDETTRLPFAFAVVLPLVLGVLRMIRFEALRLVWDLLIRFRMNIAMARGHVCDRSVNTVLFARVRVMKAAT